MKSLSHKAYPLLSLIADYTKHDDNGNLTSYWVPQATAQWSPTLKRTVYVSGAGDAAAINGFVRNGWVVPQRVAKYACALTEDGLIALENYREKYVYIDGRMPDQEVEVI